jgi:hypothetical protein
MCIKHPLTSFAALNTVHCAAPSWFCRRAEGLFTVVLLQKIVFTMLVLETKNNPTCSPEMNK